VSASVIAHAIGCLMVALLANVYVSVCSCVCSDQMTALMQAQGHQPTSFGAAAAAAASAKQHTQLPQLMPPQFFQALTGGAAGLGMPGPTVQQAILGQRPIITTAQQQQQQQPQQQHRLKGD
jgi:hypothetical protein